VRVGFIKKKRKMTAGVLKAVRALRRQQEATGTVSYKHNTWGAKNLRIDLSVKYIQQSSFYSRAQISSETGV
jgi:hypothetical protein